MERVHGRVTTDKLVVLKAACANASHINLAHSRHMAVV